MCLNAHMGGQQTVYRYLSTLETRICIDIVVMHRYGSFGSISFQCVRGKI